MSSDEPDLDAIRRAQQRVAGVVHRTPTRPSRTFSERVGATIQLKCEHLQRTGSFKVRGALNRLLTLPAPDLARGVVTVSAGNHAQAVAWAAAHAGVPATVVMPESASRTKAEASAGYGAQVILHGTAMDAFAKARSLAEERGFTFVHPFDDPEVLAGQGTVALELLDDVPDVRTVVVPVGGGGLIGGITAALAQAAPHVRVWGVEPEGADTMTRSLAAGAPQRLERLDTIADGLAAPMSGDLPFRWVRDHAAGVRRVSDDDIASALVLALERTKQLLEPAGAAGLAALLGGVVPLDDGPVVVILSGGNVDVDRLGGLVARARARPHGGPEPGRAGAAS